MVASCTNICAHCAAEIEAGQRWVREKVYERCTRWARATVAACCLGGRQYARGKAQASSGHQLDEKRATRTSDEALLITIVPGRQAGS